MWSMSSVDTDEKKRTDSVNPEQSPSRHPFTELVAAGEPLRSSLVLMMARDMVICGWIRWRLPPPKTFP